MPNRTIGFELEVRSNAQATLDHLYAAGLTGHTHLHAYHCGCESCDPDNIIANGYLFKAQQDGTCNGEFITGILEYGSPAMNRAIRGLSRSLIAGGARVSGNVGNHVHVYQGDLDGAAKLRLTRLFVRYQDQLDEIASAGQSGVRGYNSKLQVDRPYRDRYLTPNAAPARPMLWEDTVPRMQHGYEMSPYEYASGSYLAWKNPTVEFRLWNATRAAWRIRTHVGLSYAMVEAAANGVDCTENDPRIVEDVIGDFLDAPTWTGLLRQRYEKGGIA